MRVYQCTMCEQNSLLRILEKQPAIGRG